MKYYYLLSLASLIYDTRFSRFYPFPVNGLAFHPNGVGKSSTSLVGWGWLR